jgi:hypothetical protein
MATAANDEYRNPRAGMVADVLRDHGNQSDDEDESDAADTAAPADRDLVSLWLSHVIGLPRRPRQ